MKRRPTQPVPWVERLVTTFAGLVLGVLVGPMLAFLLALPLLALLDSDARFAGAIVAVEIGLFGGAVAGLLLPSYLGTRTRRRRGGRRREAANRGS